jgi:hypothetical protein
MEDGLYRLYYYDHDTDQKEEIASFSMKDGDITVMSDMDDLLEGFQGPLSPAQLFRLKRLEMSGMYQIVKA